MYFPLSKRHAVSDQKAKVHGAKSTVFIFHLTKIGRVSRVHASCRHVEYDRQLVIYVSNISSDGSSPYCVLFVIVVVMTMMMMTSVFPELCLYFSREFSGSGCGRERRRGRRCENLCRMIVGAMGSDSLSRRRCRFLPVLFVNLQ